MNKIYFSSIKANRFITKSQKLAQQDRKKSLKDSKASEAVITIQKILKGPIGISISDTIVVSIENIIKNLMLINIINTCFKKL